MFGVASVGQAQSSTKPSVQSSANPWGTGEFYLGGSYASGGGNQLENAPVNIEFEDDWSFIVGGGYNLTKTSTSAVR